MRKDKLFYFLISIGIIGRLFLRKYIPEVDFCMFDMFALVAAPCLLSGILGGIYRFATPLTIMFITDAYFYGLNFSYSLKFIAMMCFFTWSGFIFISMLGKFAKNSNHRVLKLTGLGIIGVLIYDLWTNFGFWLGPFYKHNLDGLILCYINAIPFTIGHLISTVIVVPIASTIFFMLHDNRNPFILEKARVLVCRSAENC